MMIIIIDLQFNNTEKSNKFDDQWTWVEVALKVYQYVLLVTEEYIIKGRATMIVESVHIVFVFMSMCIFLEPNVACP